AKVVYTKQVHNKTTLHSTTRYPLLCDCFSSIYFISIIYFVVLYRPARTCPYIRPWPSNLRCHPSKKNRTAEVPTREMLGNTGINCLCIYNFRPIRADVHKNRCVATLLHQRCRVLLFAF